MRGRIIKLDSHERTTILKATKRENLKIKSFCNIGLCGKCTVKIKSGNISPPTSIELKRLGTDRINEGYRLACKTTFVGKITIEI